MRTSILSPGSMCQSVRFGSLTLSNDQETVFWGEIEFSKFQKLELSLSCSSFLRQLKIRENKIRRTELQSRESSQKLAAGSCYLQFPDIKLNESRAVLFLGEIRVIASGEEKLEVDKSEPSVGRWTAEATH